MTSGNLIAILTALAAVVTILTWLGVTVNGRALIGRIRAWIDQPRKEREALEHRIGELEKNIELLAKLSNVQGEMINGTHKGYTREIDRLEERVTVDEQKLTEIRPMIDYLTSRGETLSEAFTTYSRATDDRLRALEDRVFPP